MRIDNTQRFSDVLKLCACGVGGCTWCHSVDADYLGGLNDGCFTLPDNQHAHERNVILICRNRPRSHSNLSLDPNISEIDLHNLSLDYHFIPAHLQPNHKP